MGELSLNGEWLVTWADGLHGKSRHVIFSVADPERYLTFQFPGSIQSNLLRLEVIEDPRIGINSLKARWVEEHFWIIRKKFILPPEAIDQDPNLWIDIIDGVAQIFINGVKVGEHSNSHRPVMVDLSLAVKPGENEITLLLESGLFKVADLPGALYSINDDTILNKRHHLRQPQYQFGWDWNPRLVYIGLHGDMRICWGENPRLIQISVVGEVSEDLKSGLFRISPSWFVPGDQKKKISLVVSCDQTITYQGDFELSPGENEKQFSFSLSEPKLWWPRGYGSQNLIDLELLFYYNNVIVERRLIKTGLRRVEINQPPHPEEGYYFQLKINNQVVFCKGSNWIPPEMSAFEVSPEKLRKLINLAIEQEFNILRIWGGGVWAGYELLSMCDEAGIMVWHDLLFACSKYPADNPEFLREVQKEITWGLKEFSMFPSLIVWCGNNELEWGLWSWDYQDFGTVAPDYVLFHHVVPNLISKIDPSRPYWPSSPYSSPEVAPNDPTRGDQHPWQVSILDNEKPEDIWQYRHFIDRFPNEGGVLGISPDPSLRQFLMGEDYKVRSIAWEHHDNTVNFWHPRRGVGYLMVEDWFGVHYLEFPIDRLAMASGLIQAEGLKEYIRNYRRRFPSTTSAIYWDYVDSWPSVHGWGTIDYYLKKKPSFYSVKRSNQPLIVVLADETALNNQTGKVAAYVVNETSQKRNLVLQVGQFYSDAELMSIKKLLVSVKPFSVKRCLLLEKREDHVTVARLLSEQDELIDWDRILFKKIKDLPVLEPQIEVSVVEKSGIRYARYFSKTWVWGVLLSGSENDELADNAFDLFPCLPYDIPIGAREEPYPVQITGNQLFLERQQENEDM